MSAFVWWVLATVVLGPVVVLAGMSIASRWMSPPGLTEDGHLRACLSRPNCVRSGGASGASPLQAIEAREPDAAWRAVIEILAAEPRAEIVSQTDRYVHARFTTPVFRFIDDVEFLRDEENGRIDFRSASRVGYSDLGANRRRMERLLGEIQRRMGG